MAKRKLQAKWFIAPNGIVTPKAAPLNSSFRLRFFNRSSKRCSICLADVHFFRDKLKWVDRRMAHIDHIIPRSRGGQNEDGNLQITCAACNLSKGAK